MGRNDALRERLRLRDSTAPAKRLRAERPNHVWALDFQFDTTNDGRTLKLFRVVDEHAREALAIRVARSIDSDHTVGALDQIVRERGTGPELVRMDNGPEMTANALRDWCRLGGAGRSFIEPGSPWQNPFVESFGSRVRDEALSVEAFASLLETRTVIDDWKDIYNHGASCAQVLPCRATCTRAVSECGRYHNRAGGRSRSGRDLDLGPRRVFVALLGFSRGRVSTNGIYLWRGSRWSTAVPYGAFRCRSLSG